MTHEFLYKSALKELQEVLLQGYFEGVHASAETVSFGSGNVSFHNVKLHPNFFQHLSLPLKLEYGKIDLIQIDHFDITSLFNVGVNAQSAGDAISSSSLLLKGVEIAVVPNAVTKASYREMYKSLRLVLEELFHSFHTEVPWKGGVMQMLLHMHVSIENVKVLYRDLLEAYQLELTLDTVDQQSRMQKSTRRRQKSKKSGNDDDGGGEFEDDTEVTFFTISGLSVTHMKETEDGKEETTLLQPFDCVINCVHEYIPSKDEADKIVTKSSKKKKKKQKAEEQSQLYADSQMWGLSFVVVSSSELQINLTPAAVGDLWTIAHNLSFRLFDELKEDNVSHNLDLLRWFPVSGHAHDYWKHCLRTALPKVIGIVAKKQKIQLPDQWAKVYGLMSPQGHKERYIHLFQRSLNLVGMEPLSNLESAEMRELEQQHAVDTLLLWRTESKIRTFMERQDPSSRMVRAGMDEMKRGVMGAVFQVYQEVLPSMELDDSQKREALKEALKFLKGSIQDLVVEGINFSLVCGKNAGGTSVRLVDRASGTDTCLYLEEMNLEIDYNMDRYLISLIANGVKETAMGPVLRMFGQQHSDGRFDFFTRFPHENAKGADRRVISALFMQHMHILDMNFILRCLAKFGYQALEDARDRASIRETETKGVVDPIRGMNKSTSPLEVGLDVTVADSLIKLIPDPIQGYQMELDIVLGDPFPEEYVEPDERPNLKVSLTMIPSTNYMSANVQLHDMRVDWRKYPIAGHPELQMGPVQDAFEDTLIERLDNASFTAEIERVSVGENDDTVEEFTVRLSAGVIDAVVSQQSLGEILRVAASRLHHEHTQKSHKHSHKTKAPFSYRTFLEGLELRPNEDAGADSEEEDEEEEVSTLVLLLRALDMHTTEKRTIDDDEAAGEVAMSTKSLMDRFVAKLGDHLVDGLLSTNLSLNFTKEAKSRRRSLAPLLERMRKTVLAAEAWNSSLTKPTYLRADNMLLWDIMQADSTRFQGARIGTVIGSLPQGLSEVMLDAHVLHSRLILEDMRDAVHPAHLRGAQRNPKYLSLTLEDVEYFSVDAGKEIDKVLVSSRNIFPSSLDEEVAGGFELLQGADSDAPPRVVVFPSTDEKRYAFDIRVVDVRMEVSGAPFLSFRLLGSESSLLRDADPHAEPDAKARSVALTCDIRLAKEMMHLQNMQMRTGSHASVHTDVGSLIRLFRACHVHAVTLSKEGGASPLHNFTLHLKDFDWLFVSHDEHDSNFKLRGQAVMALPYEFFSSSEDDHEFSIMLKSRLTLNVVKRLVPMESSFAGQGADMDSDEDDDFDFHAERLFINGEADNFEVAHVAPPSWKPPSQLTQLGVVKKAALPGDNKEEDGEDESIIHLPNLPLHFPTGRDTVRDAEGNVLFKIASQVIDPCTVEFHAVVADSELHAHSSGEDAKKVRKNTGRHVMTGLKFSNNLVANISMRDIFFLTLAAVKMETHSTPVSSDLNFEFDMLTEFDMDILADTAVVNVLDQLSNQESKNPVVTLDMKDIKAKVFSFASRRGMEMDATLAVDYGVMPGQEDAEPLPQVADAMVGRLLYPTPFKCSVYRDAIGDSNGTNVVSMNIDFEKAVRAFVTVPFMATTVARLYNLGQMYGEALVAVDKDMHLNYNRKKKKDEYEDVKENSGTAQDDLVRVPSSLHGDGVPEVSALEQENKHDDHPDGDADADVRKDPEQKLVYKGGDDQDDDEDVVRLVKLKNNLGVTSWFTRAVDRKAIPVILGDQEELDVDLKERPAPANYDRSQSDFAINVALDGGWTPALVVDLLPGFASIQTITSQVGPSFLKLKTKSLNVQLESKLKETVSHGVKQSELTIAMHSAVRIINTTSDAFLYGDDVLEPGHKEWLSVPAASTGSIAIRPSQEHSWTDQMSFDLSEWRDHKNSGGDMWRFHEVECQHIASSITWAYVVRVFYNASTKITNLEVRAPIQISNCLPFPVTISVVRAAQKRNVAYYWDKYSSDPNSAPTDGIIQGKEEETESESEYSNELTEEKLKTLADDDMDSLDMDLEFGSDDELGGLNGPLKSKKKKNGKAVLKGVKKKVTSKSNVITHNVERGLLKRTGGSWDVHGGKAYAQASVSIRVHDSAQARADGFFSIKRIPLEDSDLLAEGWLLTDSVTNRTLRVFVMDAVTDPDEAKYYRRLRVFTHYTFIDHTNLQLRFTEDKHSFMTSHYMHPYKEAGKARQRLVAMSSHYDRNNKRRVYIGTPHAHKWGPPIMVPTFYRKNPDESEDSDDEYADFGGEDAWADAAAVFFAKKATDEDGNPIPDAAPAKPVYHVVRVPSTMQFSTVDPKHRGREHSDMRGTFCTEIVCSVQFPHGKLGPTEITCRPRLRIVNRLSCGLSIKQFDKLSYRAKHKLTDPDDPDSLEKEPRHVELPMYLPKRCTGAFQFWDTNPEDENHPPNLDLKNLSFLPVFTEKDGAPLYGKVTQTWEWSEPLPVNRHREFVVSVHNTNLNRRMILKVQVVVDNGHHVVVISSQDPLQLQYKVQNQTSHCSIRFTQKLHSDISALDKSKYWQTVHPGSATVPFAWHDPVDGNVPVPDGLDALQRPFLLQLRLFTHKEIFETHVDLSVARVGTRARLRLPGGRPDVLVQTRLEASTGAIVCMVSNYVPKANSRGILHTYEAEEKRFIASLLKNEVGNTLHHAEAETMLSLFPQTPKAAEAWRDKSEFGAISFQITELTGVDFQDESSVYCVVTFGKLSRRAVMYDRGAEERRFEAHTFAYDTIHDPFDPDYDNIYVDVYERNPMSGTFLKRTATIRDVKWLVKSHSPHADVEVMLHDSSFRRIDKEIGKVDHSSRMRVRLWSSTHHMNGLASVPGRASVQVAVRMAELQASWVDSPTNELLSSVSRAKGTSLEDAIHKGEFLLSLSKNVNVFVGHTHSHDFVDLSTETLKIKKKFADKDMTEGELIFVSDPDATDPVLSLSVVAERNHINALDFAYTHPGEVTDASHAVTHVVHAAYTQGLSFVKIDEAVGFRFLRFLKTMHLWDRLHSKPANPTSLIVDNVQWNRVKLQASFETANPPQDELLPVMVVELPDSLEDVTGAVGGAGRSCFNTSISAGKPTEAHGIVGDTDDIKEVKDSELMQVDTSIDAEINDEEERAPKDTVRGVLTVPEVQRKMKVHWGERVLDNGMLEVLRLIVSEFKTAVEERIEPKLGHLDGFDAFAQKLPYYREELDKSSKQARARIYAAEKAAAADTAEQEEEDDDDL